MTASKFLELDKAQQEKALDDIASEAQYGIDVGITSNGIKLTGLEPAQAAKWAAQDAKGAACGLSNGWQW